MAGELEEMVKEGFKIFQKVKQTVDDASKVVKAANEVVLEKRKQMAMQVKEKLASARKYDPMLSTTEENRAAIRELADAIEIILEELEP